MGRNINMGAIAPVIIAGIERQKKEEQDREEREWRREERERERQQWARQDQLFQMQQENARLAQLQAKAEMFGPQRTVTSPSPESQGKIADTLKMVTPFVFGTGVPGAVASGAAAPKLADETGKAANISTTTQYWTDPVSGQVIRDRSEDDAERRRADRLEERQWRQEDRQDEWNHQETLENIRARSREGIAALRGRGGHSGGGGSGSSGAGVTPSVITAKKRGPDGKDVDVEFAIRRDKNGNIVSINGHTLKSVRDGIRLPPDIRAFLANPKIPNGQEWLALDDGVAKGGKKKDKEDKPWTKVEDMMSIEDDEEYKVARAEYEKESRSPSADDSTRTGAALRAAWRKVQDHRRRKASVDPEKVGRAVAGIRGGSVPGGTVLRESESAAVPDGTTQYTPFNPDLPTDGELASATSGVRIPFGLPTGVLPRTQDIPAVIAAPEESDESVMTNILGGASQTAPNITDGKGVRPSPLDVWMTTQFEKIHGPSQNTVGSVTVLPPSATEEQTPLPSVTPYVPALSREQLEELKRRMLQRGSFGQ
jgi:hypothetical protein